MIVDTTRSSRDSTRTYPPLLVRRLLARAIDSAIAIALACLIVLPVAFSQATDALLLAGFDSVGDFLSEWDLGSAASGSVSVALDQLQPVVLGTIWLQSLVIWTYDWLSHTLTGSSAGKAITRVRVTRHTSGFEPTFAPDRPARRAWARRSLRMGLRTGLVLGPPTLAAGMLVAAAFGVPGAVDLAEMFIALSVVLLIVWLFGGVGLHGLATGTRVVGFEWQQLMQEAEHQIEYHTGHADDYLHKLQEAARAPVERAVRSAENDPRVRSAMAQSRAGARQAEQRGQVDRDTLLEGLRSRDEAKDTAKAAALQLREAYQEDGLRGVIESFTRTQK